MQPRLKRDVQCDEAWPICGPCAKGRRYCPGPPVTRIRFVEDDTRPHELPIGGVGQTYQARSLDGSVAGGSGQYNSVRNLHMITVRSTAKDGGTFQKLRLLRTRKGGPLSSQMADEPSPMLVCPGSSAGEILARRLFTFIDCSDHGVGARVRIHGMWLKELPRRFGSSPALDSTVACLVSSHEAVIRGEDHSMWLDYQQYGKAIKALQSVVDNPKEQLSTNTLATVALMWRIEGTFAAATGLIGRQTVHAQALADMLRLRGLGPCKDNLDFLLTVDCQVAAVQSCLARDISQPCIFDSEEWDLVFQERHGRSDLSMLYWNVFREFVRYPGLGHDLYMIYLYPDKATSTIQDVAHAALRIATNLERISHSIKAALDDPKVCVTKPSATGDPLIPIVFEFRDTEAAPLLGYYCFYSIAINRMLIYLSYLLHTEVNNDLVRIRGHPPRSALDLPYFG